MNGITALGTEIRTADDDTYAAHALIGYVAEADYPVGKWVAALVDLDDKMHDPAPLKNWVEAASFEAAERIVRNNYSRWVAKR